MSDNWNFPTTEKPKSTAGAIPLGQVDLDDPNALENMTADIVNQIEADTGETLDDYARDDIKRQLEEVLEVLRTMQG